jgi:type IV secretory pathway VirJ component
MPKPLLCLLASLLLAVLPAHADPAAKPAAAKPAVAKSAAAAKKSAEPPLAANAERLNHGRFDEVVVYHPTGTPTSVVLFLSGDGGWNLGVIDMAQMLVQKGAMVVGINTPRFLKVMEQDAGKCEFPDGDLENLSHWVQAYYKLPTYLTPILVGYSSGATLAYASLVQAPRDTFGGALVLGFCPDLDLHKPICKADSALEFNPRQDGKGVDFLPAKKLDNPIKVMQGAVDQVCLAAPTQAFMAQVPNAEVINLDKVGHGYSVTSRWEPQFLKAFDQIQTALKPHEQAPPPASLNGLPVIEVPAKPGSPQTDTFAVFMTGDGGWAGLDQDVSNALAAQGIPVVGLDSLRYYWTPRTPEGAATDVDRVIRYYLAQWGKKRALLVGYSQGADVLPFILNRLPAATREQVALGAVMGLSDHAVFEFHMGNWVSDASGGFPTMPEMQKESGVPVLCVYGVDEKDTLCPKLDPSKVHLVGLPGGHHFNGDYERLAHEILAQAKLPTTAVAAAAPAQTSAAADGQTQDNSKESPMLTMHVMIAPVLSLIAGILILVMPRLLNYVIAIYLIAIGVVGLLHL